MSLSSQTQMPHTATKQVTLKTVIITFHSHLTEFLAQQIHLHKFAPNICNLNKDSFKQLSNFQQGCDRILKSPSVYESLSINERMKVFYKQKEWISIAEELKQVQVLEQAEDQSTCVDKTGRVKMETYKSFIQAKKLAYQNQQRENLLKKFSIKQLSSQIQRKRQLPPVPDFETVSVKQEHVIEEQQIDFSNVYSSTQSLDNTNKEKQSFIIELDDNLSNASTSDSSNSSMNLKPKRAAFRVCCQDSIEIISSTKGMETSRVHPQQQANNKSHSDNFSQIEEHIMQFIMKLSLDVESSTVIFKASLAMTAFILSQKSTFLAKKSASIIAAAIMLSSSKLTGYLITAEALANITDLKHQSINKALKQLSTELQNFQVPKLIAENAQMSVETLIHQTASHFNITDIQTMNACSYLYNQMQEQGLVKGIRVDILAASIVFIAATLNEIPIRIQQVQDHFLENCMDKLINAITSILFHKKSLLSNSGLFKLQHMLA